MARVTIEDCLTNLENRFELVLVASKRARQLATGGREPKVEWENDKVTVVALREIAEGHVDRSILDEPDQEAAPSLDFLANPPPRIVTAIDFNDDRD